MKLIATSFIIVFIALHCYGQKKYLLETSSGITLSRFTGHDFYDKNGKFFISSFINLNVNRQLNTYVNLAIGIEYALKGSDYEYESHYTNLTEYCKTSGSWRIHYLILPLEARIKLSNFILFPGLYTGKKITGYGEKTTECYDNGQFIKSHTSKGQLFQIAFSKPLLGTSIGFGYNINRNIIALSASRDLISIDNLNGAKTYNTCLRLSYHITLTK